MKFPQKKLLGAYFCPKSKINGHRIHDNQCTNFYWNGNTSRAGVANMRFDTFRVRDENKEKNKEKRHKGRK